MSLIALTACKTVDKSSNAVSSEDFFSIEIIQNGDLIPIIDQTVTLKKEPFKFRVTLAKTNDVTVSASWDKYYFDYPDSSNIFECNADDFKGCRFVAVKTTSQLKFNRSKNLSIGNGDYQWNWFYEESMDWHRFDSTVTTTKAGILAEMSIENIFDCDARDLGMEPSEYEYPIEKIDKEIYMVFATDHYEKGMSHPEELQREKFKLLFVD